LELLVVLHNFFSITMFVLIDYWLIFWYENYVFVNSTVWPKLEATSLNNVFLRHLKIREERLKKFLDLKKEKKLVEEPKSYSDS